MLAAAATLILLAAASAENIPKYPLIVVPPKVTVPAHPTMTSAEAIDYMVKVINPIVEAHAADPSEIATLRAALTYLAGKTVGPQKQVQVMVSSKPNAAPDRLMQLFRAKETAVVKLEIYIPTVRRLQDLLPQRDFEDIVLFTFGLQSINFAQVNDTREVSAESLETPEGNQLLEATSMGRAIDELILPMQKRGRLKTANFSPIIAIWESVNRNPRDPKWLAIFAGQ